MKAECIEAVQQAAVQFFGKKLQAHEVKNIEDKVYQTGKVLARKDVDAWRSMTSEERLQKVSETIAQDLMHDRIRKQKNAERAVIVADELYTYLDKMRGFHKSNVDTLAGFIFTRENGQSIETHAKAIAGDYKRALTDFWDMQHDGTFANLLGDPKMRMDFVKEMHNEPSNNPVAKKGADAVKKVYESMRRQYNELGGDIGKLENYNLPQMQDAYKILGVSWFKDGKNIEQARSDYVDTMMEAVNREVYVNDRGDYMTDEKMREFLSESFKTIITGGATKETPQYGSGVANRHKAHRQIFYKDAESYMKVMEKYGSTDMFSMVMNHIDGMSRDIALLERGGPQAEQLLKEAAKKMLDADINEGKNTHSTYNKVNALLDHYLGKADPVQNMRVAKIGQDIRNWMVSTFLGSVPISQLVDQATSLAAARAANIPMFDFYKAQFQTMGKEGMNYARRQGLGWDTALNNMIRVSDGISSHGITGKLANATLQVSGANLMTNFVRNAFGIMHMDALGSNTLKYKGWADIPELDRRILERNGITERDYAIWSKAGVDTTGGHTLLSPERFDLIDVKEVQKEFSLSKNEAEKAIRDAKLSMLGMVHKESHMAVLSPSEWTSETMNVGTKGTVGGELWRTMTQFKSFPVTFMMKHWERMNAQEGVWNKAAYSANLLTMTTIFGGLALMLGDIANGRDPRRMYDPNNKGVSYKFATEALLKGGGLGIMGDILGGTDYLGRDPGGKMMGPGIGTAINVGQAIQAGYKYGIGQIGGAEFKGSVAKEAAEAFRTSLPFQNLWYTKAAVNAYLLNNFQEMANPGYKERIKKMAAKHQNTQYWLTDEETRAPNFGNISTQ